MQSTKRNKKKEKTKTLNYLECPVLPVLPLDLSIRADGSNTGRVYSGSGKIRVGCISGSGKIREGIFQFYGFQINPTGLKRLFSESKNWHIYHLKLSVFNEQAL